MPSTIFFSFLFEAVSVLLRASNEEDSTASQQAQLDLSALAVKWAESKWFPSPAIYVGQ